MGSCAGNTQLILLYGGKPRLEPNEIIIFDRRDPKNKGSGGGVNVLWRIASEVAKRLDSNSKLYWYSCSQHGLPKEEILEKIIIRRYAPYPLLNFISPLVLLRHRRRSILVVDACTPISYFSKLFTATPVVTVIYHISGEELMRSQYFGTLGRLTIGPIAYIGEKLTIKNSGGLPVITFSEHTAKTLGQLEKVPNPLIYIKEGIVLPKIREGVCVESPRGSNHQLVTVGRVVRSKRIEFSLFLTSRLKDSFPDVLLHVIGKGSYMEQLKEISEKLGLDNNVVFHGYVSEEEKNVIVSQSKLLIVTSKKEGFSTPAIEAGIFGVPTVGFDEFGTREAVEDGVTGVIVPYGDVEGLYMACASLFTDEELYLKLSKNCKTRAEEFDNNLMITKGANALIALSKRVIKAS